MPTNVESPLVAGLLKRLRRLVLFNDLDLTVLILNLKSKLRSGKLLGYFVHRFTLPHVLRCLLLSNTIAIRGSISAGVWPRSAS